MDKVWWCIKGPQGELIPPSCGVDEAWAWNNYGQNREIPIDELERWIFARQAQGYRAVRIRVEEVDRG